jgi:hypothetical protein
VHNESLNSVGTAINNRLRINVVNSVVYHRTFVPNLCFSTYLSLLIRPVFWHSALVAVLGKLTPEQRCYVHIRYEQMFETSLPELLKKEVGGRRAFGKTLHYLSVNPVMADCAIIHDACTGNT